MGLAESASCRAGGRSARVVDRRPLLPESCRLPEMVSEGPGVDTMSGFTPVAHKNRRWGRCLDVSRPWPLAADGTGVLPK